MKTLSYLEIREKFLKFMISKGHIEIPNSPLVPENDPTLLFVNAGMVPLVPFLLGEKHPSGTRLTNVQRCIRTIDIDEVGDDIHCTSFEMLGNWSLNDYFKKEALQWSVEFFINELGFDISNIYASVYEGDKNIGIDQCAIDTWKEIFKSYGIAAEVGAQERIQPLGDNKKHNWWELESGGPCGPCSEFFYDTGKPKCNPDCNTSCGCGKYTELGNNVFMEYLKKDGNYSKLDRHNIDFGGGLDRYAYISQNTESVFSTDIYLPILEKVKSISSNENTKSQRVIVDHIKAATWMIMDGITPGRTEQSYILRRLIRRSVRHARQLGITENLSDTVATVAIDQFSPIYPKLADEKQQIIDVIKEEESKFKATINDGMKKLDKFIQENNKISGEDAFYLYETYGFPIEITQEILEEKGLNKIDTEDFENAFNSHKEKSRSAAKGFFKGGLADTSEMSKKYHTATHMLNAALRKVLGDHVKQLGSNINPDRLRFDFPNDTKLTPEQVKQVEDIINEQINTGLEVYFEEMDKQKALELAPHSAFTEKYGEIVKVYFIGRGDKNISIEICGGPHVQNTKDLGSFKIVKQENVGAGVKRIKAVVG
ncbi:alanine--tRNA ligase [Candidatus Dojkabacteria bacterium]|nr:alanine--tRNA ligase [Candidatus Dojkabacteria bacterium]